MIKQTSGMLVLHSSLHAHYGFVL